MSGPLSSILLPRGPEHARGERRILSGTPGIEAHGPVYYLPHREEGHWGIFHPDDRPVELCVERAFEGMVPNRQIPESTTAYRAVEAGLPDGVEYVYGGRFTPLFGHFLLETLARFWPYLGGFTPRQRVVMHGDGRPADWFRLPYVARLLGAFGLSPEIIVHAEAPVRIPNLTVSEPAFRPQAQGYPLFVDFCREIGGRIGAAPAPRGGPPVYLSKTRLVRGVAHWRNEAAIEAVLARAGVEILHPQDLSIEDHVALFGARRTVCGLVGSAHHVSLLRPDNPRFVLLAPERFNANFLLLDALTGTRAEYYYPAGTHNVERSGERFIVERVVAEPERVAAELLERL